MCVHICACACACVCVCVCMNKLFVYCWYFKDHFRKDKNLLLSYFIASYCCRNRVVVVALLDVLGEGLMLFTMFPSGCKSY